MGIGHQLSITGDQWKSILCKVASLAAFFPSQRFGLRWSVGAVLMEDGLAVEIRMWCNQLVCRLFTTTSPLGNHRATDQQVGQSIRSRLDAEGISQLGKR
jgi:hypothetical protein